MSPRGDAARIAAAVGRLAPLAIDRTGERLTMSHIFIDAGGLSPAQMAEDPVLARHADAAALGKRRTKAHIPLAGRIRAWLAAFGRTG